MGKEDIKSAADSVAVSLGHGAVLRVESNDDADLPRPDSFDGKKYRDVVHPDSKVFAAGADAALYAPVDTYEGRHRYDPTALWEPAEERRLVRRLDLRITCWCCLMFFAMQLDRGNLTQALADGLLSDLGLNSNQYNLANTLYYVCFFVAELPAQMISKRVGPDVWMPAQMVAWSAVACCQAALPKGPSAFYAVRSLLGVLEGGFIPDVVLYMSYFFTNRELPKRLAAFWCTYVGTMIVSAFMAYGILHMRGTDGWAGWRWLFVIEGALTALIGVLSYFYLPASPVQTDNRRRLAHLRRVLFWKSAPAVPATASEEDNVRHGWFTPREEIILVNRILRDDPGKGRMHNREGLNWKRLKMALADYDLWPVYLLGLTWAVPPSPAAYYLTINLKELGFGTFRTTLMTIPAYGMFLFMLLLWTITSEIALGKDKSRNVRLIFVLVGQIYMMPYLLTLELMPDSASPWAWYGVAIGLLGFPYVHPILVGFTSRNSGNIQTRTVSTALYNMAVQASSIISSNIYQKGDAPHYRKGNKVLLALMAWNITLIVFMMFYYPYRNRQKARAWNAMTSAEKDAYIASTVDTGTRRLDFRFAY